MDGKIFVDTNILIYAHDKDAGGKHFLARNIITDLWENKNGILSTQVLQEFYVNVTKKIQKPLSKNEAREIIQQYFTWEVVLINNEMILQASRIEEKQKISFWDALIVVAGNQVNASFLLSEDFNHAQRFGNLLVQNPFK